MKKNLLLILYLLASVNSIGQKHVPEKDLTLHGKVHWVIYREFECTTLEVSGKWISTDTEYYNALGNYTLVISKNSDSTMDYREEYEYDSTGYFLMHYSSYNNKGTIDEEKFYEYDEAGYEIYNWQLQYDDGDTDGVVYHYIYNNKKQVIECRCNYEVKTRYDQVDEEADYRNSFDNSGNLIACYYYENGKIRDSINTEYDTLKCKLREQYSQNKSYVLYEYGSTKKKMTERYYDLNNKFLSLNKFYYDTKGNEYLREEYDENKNLKTSRKRDFTDYDRTGNARKIKLYINGELKSRMNLTIEYF